MKKYILIVSIIVAVILVSVLIPVLQKKKPSNLSEEEEQFVYYTLNKVWNEDFDAPLLKLLRLKLLVESVGNVGEGTCKLTQYTSGSKDVLLENKYQATVKIKTFFGITLRTAEVYCDGSKII